MNAWTPSLGAWLEDGGATFRVWAPAPNRIELVLGARIDRLLPLQRDADGYARVHIPGVGPGKRYGYRIDGGSVLPDPASRWQPDGVHALSEVVAPAFEWTDHEWHGLDPDAVVLYELHIGTFTEEGTFEAAAAQLEALVDLGVTAIQIMPVAAFPGRRNWGYDGVSLFAPCREYGHPDNFRVLVDRAHRLGLGVILDVVYNHFGPDGAYHAQFSHEYFTERHVTPWGAAINLDAPGSREVRRFIIENALHWIHEYHVDGLRLDAVHTLADDSQVHLLAELRDVTAAAHRPGQPPPFLVAEEHRNLVDVVRTRAAGGYGFDAIYADDFHHECHRLLTGDTDGFLRDYEGRAAGVARCLNIGWSYTGQHSAYEGGPRGTDPQGTPLPRFMHCLQNHDQIGNRAFGDRLAHEIAPAAYRAASAVLLFDAATPLLFQGDEWAASTPFLYFTDHEPTLGSLVREGRRGEFAHWRAFRDPGLREHIPDPQAERSFTGSRLRWEEREHPLHAPVLALYQALLAIRRTEPALRWDAHSVQRAVAPEEGVLVVRRERAGAPPVVLLARLAGSGGVSGGEPIPLLSLPAGMRWSLRFTTEDPSMAIEPLPVVLDLAAPEGCYFLRPGAVMLRAEPETAT